MVVRTKFKEYGSIVCNNPSIFCLVNPDISKLKIKAELLKLDGAD